MELIGPRRVPFFMIGVIVESKAYAEESIVVVTMVAQCDPTHFRS